MRALRDPRPLTILAVTIVLSAALAFTPLPGRAWLILGWGILMYLAAVVVVARSWARRDHPPPPPPGSPDEVDWIRLTEEALRKLNNPAALGQCALADHLARTLDRRNGQAGAPLRHQQLRAVLVEAIGRLKPAEDMVPGEQSRYFRTLHDEYVLGHSTAQIAIRNAVGERTVFRDRRDAIRALAQDLAAQEAALAESRS